MSEYTLLAHGPVKAHRLSTCLYIELYPTLSQSHSQLHSTGQTVWPILRKRFEGVLTFFDLFHFLIQLSIASFVLVGGAVVYSS